MRLRRHMDDHADEVSSPQMVKMFHGNLKDRRNLLHSWLKSGEVASKCEFQLNIQRSSQDDLVTEEQLLTVDGMRKAGISETLVYAFIVLAIFLVLLVGMNVCVCVCVCV